MSSRPTGRPLMPIAFAVLALCTCADAARDQPPAPAFLIGIENWFSTGRSKWESGYAERDPDLLRVRTRSCLRWRDMEAVLYRMHAQYRVSPWLRLGAAYGFAEIDEGSSKQTDRRSDGWRPYYVTDRSVTDSGGDLVAFDLNAFFRLNEFFNFHAAATVWDVVLGYQYYEEDLKNRNGMVRRGFERTPIEGLRNTYAFEWQALRLGLRTDIPLAGRLHARGQFVCLLGIHYQGEAFWYDLENYRAISPNVVHEASDGFGMDVKISLWYDFSSRVFAEAGFWWLYLQAKDGTQTIYPAEGDIINDRTLDSVDTRRHGFVVGLGGRF